MLEFIQQAHNAVYLVPLALGLCLFVFQLVGFGMSGGHDADVDHDVDVDVDHDVDVDVDHDVDVDADHDVDVDADHDVDHDHDVDGHDVSVVGGALRFLNFGRVPFLVVLQSVLLSFGVVGLSATYFLAETGRVAAGTPMLVVSLPIAFVLGLGLSKALTALLGSLAPTVETKDTRIARLVGELVTVESALVDATQGRGTWKDATGNNVTIYLRTEPGAPPISKGARARLERYVPHDKIFICVPGGDVAEPRKEPAP